VVTVVENTALLAPDVCVAGASSIGSSEHNNNFHLHLGSHLNQSGLSMSPSCVHSDVEVVNVQSMDVEATDRTELFPANSELQEFQSDWSRDEDKLILEMCKELGPSIETFEQIADSLSGRSCHEIMERFSYLLTLLSSLQNVPDDFGGEGDDDGDDAVSETV
jgi:hypothetical protein